MKIQDLTGLSKPLTKLIEVISQGIGAISKPYLIKKTADAKAYEVAKLAEAVKDHQDKLRKIDYNNTLISISSIDNDNLILENYPLEERTQKRINFQENIRQQNIESITKKAFNNLEIELEVSSDKVDNDWITRFFIYAQDISNDDMQKLWSRILSEEVKRPNTFSLRTLELVRNLSKKEAELFTKVANYAIKAHGDSYLFRDGDIIDKYKIKYNDIALLQEIGLIHSTDFVTQTILKNKIQTNISFDFGKYVVKMLRRKNAPEQKYLITPFTKTGIELLNLIERNPDFTYLKFFAKKLQNNFVDIRYAQITGKKDNKIQHSEPLTKFDAIM